MEVKLLHTVLVGDSDVIPTRNGTVVDLPEGKAREFIAHGIAVEAAAEEAAGTAGSDNQKEARLHPNKMEPEPANKAARARNTK